LGASAAEEIPAAEHAGAAAVLRAPASVLRVPEPQHVMPLHLACQIIECAGAHAVVARALGMHLLLLLSLQLMQQHGYTPLISKTARKLKTYTAIQNMLPLCACL
jgi:hypothetical protein